MIESAINGIVPDDPEVDRLFTYVRIAEKTGWSPEQINKLDTVFVQDLLLLIGAERKKEQEEIKSGNSRQH